LGWLVPFNSGDVVPFPIDGPVLPYRVSGEVRKVSLNQPIVTMCNCPSMMGGFVDGVVHEEMLREDMLPSYAHGHLSI
jgi:hypothetical protein